MEVTHYEALQQLHLMFDKVDDDTIKNTLHANKGELQKTVTDLLYLEREQEKKKVIEEEDNRRLGRKRKMSNHHGSGYFLSCPHKENLYRDPKFDYESQQYNKQDLSLKRRITSMSINNMGLNFDSKDAMKATKDAMRFTKDAMKSTKDVVKNLAAGKQGRQNLAEDGKYYGPIAEEKPLTSVGHHRSGSLVDKLKSGFTFFLKKGTKDAAEKGEYAKIGAVGDHEVNDYAYQGGRDLGNHSGGYNNNVLGEMSTNTMNGGQRNGEEEYHENTKKKHKKVHKHGFDENRQHIAYSNM